MKDRRTTQQIYYDIMSAIMNEQETSDKSVKITRVQLKSKLSFDKIKSHIQTMIQYDLMEDECTITQKGYVFYKEFHEIQILINRLQNKLQIPIRAPIPKNITITLDMIHHVRELVTFLEDQLIPSNTPINMQQIMK